MQEFFQKNSDNLLMAAALRDRDILNGPLCNIFHQLYRCLSPLEEE